ncbi:MAG: sugar transferase [Clostridia bacterium]|nr:sugar transferase [Clostridia bacterium]MDE7214524.1 sugar transferase [Clostridia bacterium]
MPEFLKTPAGHAVLGVIIAVVLIIFIDLNYRFFMKAVLDFLFALLATVILLFPLIVPLAIISKVRAGQTFENTPYIGVKGKIIRLKTFTGVKCGLKYIPRLFDVMGGKLSFVGVKPLKVSDGALISDEHLSRFNARSGLVCHLALKGDENLTYEEMFALDERYAKKRELFTDLFILIKTAVLKIRGEGKSYFGEAAKMSYGEALLARGEITKEDLARAEEYGEEAVAEADKTAEFRKKRI